MRLCFWFDKKGFKRKNVALVGELSYEWIATFYALSMVGAVPVLIDPHLKKENIDTLLKQSNSDLVIGCNTALGLEQDSRGLYVNLNLGEELINNNSCFEIKQILKDIPKITCVPFQCSPDDVALLAFTSGTTGKQKVVMLTHRNLICDMLLSYYLAGRGNDTATVAVLPPHHLLELTTGIQTPIYVGCPICICGDKKKIIKSFIDFKPSILILVPYVIQMMWKQVWSQARVNGKTRQLKLSMLIASLLLKFHIDIRNKVFSSIHEFLGGRLKTIISGGAQLAADVIADFHNWGIEIYNGYGITECSPVVCCNMPKFSKRGSVGLVTDLPFVSLKIENGEVCVSGEIVMKGYYKDDDLTNESFHNNYFKTGDLGFIDKDGYLYLTGRKKNLIILGNGENVSPEELEEEFSKIKGVKDVIVFASEVNGTALLNACVLPNEGLGYMNDIQNYFNQQFSMVSLRLPTHKQVHNVIIREKDFIRSASGKVKRIEENYKA